MSAVPGVREPVCPNVAPGAPGVPPSWTSSAKDIITTALGASRVWATVGDGIVNEVYWPSAGRPQVRDLGFIVAGSGGWHEVKCASDYEVTLPKPFLPLPRILHNGSDYQLDLQLSPDPSRDVLLISFRLIGQTKLYVLLAPHIGGNGSHNNAHVDGGLAAWRDEEALYLAADCGFSRGSAGYVGSSDGWQDFSCNGDMRWTYTEALDGNVALTGELASSCGVLALAFAGTIEGARTLAQSSLSEGFETAQAGCAAGWESWAAKLDLPEAPEAIRREACLSAMVIKAHEGKTYPGSVVASLSIPWGNTTDSIGGYHLVWARDAVETGLALLAMGLVDDARRLLGYLIATQRPDGSWSQNSFPDSRPFWTGIQLDEVGFPILLAAKLHEVGSATELSGLERMLRKAAGYVARNGPISPQDRWEENAGISPFTVGIEIAALVAAAERLAEEDRTYALSLADYWNERIEDWTYVADPEAQEKFGVDGFYVRIASPAIDREWRGRPDVGKRQQNDLKPKSLIGMEYLYLPRLGLRHANDFRIQNTLKVSEAVLRVETLSGAAYRRYDEDAYGEYDDGRPFDGNGVGRAWPLLVGERGHLDVLLGQDPLPYLERMARMTGRGGLIPEQVWDAAPIPERGLFSGKPSGSVMPLVWAHAEFLKLLVARTRGRPVEMLECVQNRWWLARPVASTWHWRTTEPFDRLPAARSLVIEHTEPFRLHYGFDGWRNPMDLDSEPLGLEMHGVRFGPEQLGGRDRIEFSFYLLGQDRWEGVDHHVCLDEINSTGLHNAS